MSIRQTKVLASLLTMIIFLIVISSAVKAESIPIVELPVTVTLKSTPLPDYEVCDYTIILEADNPDFPMPDGSVDGMYKLIITGEATVKLPEIRFNSVGIYTYTIYQLKPGSDEVVGYDETKYNLVVYVTNAENGSGLETTVLLYLLGQTEKLDAVIFSPPVVKESIVDPEPPKTSDDTVIWPYLALFSSGAAMLFILGVTKKKGKYED